MSEWDDSYEFPVPLPDAEIPDFCASLVGLPADEVKHLAMQYSNVELLYIPPRTILLEIDGEQRREHKKKHYSIEIGEAL